MHDILWYYRGICISLYYLCLMVSSCIACLNILFFCVALLCIVLYGIVLYFMVLWYIALFCFLRLYFKVLFGIVIWHCMLHTLNGLTWYYLNLLHGIVWHWGFIKWWAEANNFQCCPRAEARGQHWKLLAEGHRLINSL